MFAEGLFEVGGRPGGNRVKLAFAFAGALLLSASSATAQQVDLASGSIVETVTHLKAGQFVWAPEVAPKGPMLLIVNVVTQRAVLFRNGVPIGASTVSTGRPGHATPTGVFTILQKQVEHYSSLYDSAPMPYMQRLTWEGVALHAGNLPGYPASHGCIRLPEGFAKLLYGETKVGMTVVITREQMTPRFAPTPAIVAQGAEPSEFSASYLWEPAVGQHWVRLTLSAKASDGGDVAKGEWARFHAGEDFRRAVASIIGPGTTIIVTSDSVAENSIRPIVVLEGRDR